MTDGTGIRANRRRGMVYGGGFLLLVLFFALTVRSGDDLVGIARARSMPFGWDYLELAIRRYYVTTNGRVLGNLLHQLLVDQWLAASVVKAGISVGIAWAVLRLANVRSLYAVPVVLVLTVIPGASMTRQVIMWNAGYFNYAAPVLPLLIIVLLLLRERTAMRNLALLLLAFASALFAENVTLMACVSVLVYWVALLIRRRRIDLGATAVLLGLLLGAALMFGSPAYRDVVGGTDAYRTVPGSGPSGNLIGRLAGAFEPLTTQLLVVLIPISVALVMVLVLRGTRPLSPVRASGSALMVFAAFALLTVTQFSWPHLDGRMRLVFFALLLALQAALVVIALVLIGVHDLQSRVAVILVAFAFATLTPFAVITPFGPRNAYLPYVFVLAAVLMLASPWLNTRLGWPRYRLAAVVAALAVACVVTGMFAANKVVEVVNYRSAVQQLDAGKHRITLRQYPFGDLVQDGSNGPKYLLLIGASDCAHLLCVPDKRIEVVFR